ncbi:hypothetical protein VNI00_010720 [Paramarasmius palmivorus]|uniref:DUF1479-domain-containing protein n=1 Tax=Paramarasmius palmivorus TaxID=297713 RepID=A0AAW0CFB8_9AGAR
MLPQEEHLLKIKKEIANSFPDFEARASKAWKEIIVELAEAAKTISAAGPNYIPQVNFSDLSSLPASRVEEIKRKGSVVIRDVVDDAQAAAWKRELDEFVKKNPVEGFPEGDKQFFMLYWTKPQVEARSHPNMLSAQTWLNNLYSAPDGKQIDGVDLNTPLTYADRFRIRHPGVEWQAHPPHIDGGSIERWEDPDLRKCFEDILSGRWRSHNPYDLTGRLNARTSLYKRPNQATIFRTFQGWLAMSETAPTQGTLKVFPDVLLSNSYLILRPFFQPTVPIESEEILDSDNWKFDISYPEFPGLVLRDGGYAGPQPTPAKHPHLFLDKTMTSVPKVLPGDTVFWHCDVVHSVEREHTGSGDSAVMYIPAVPSTPLNQVYIERQKETFLKGTTPPDFPKAQVQEAEFIGTGKPDDILSPVGKHAMGFPIAVV